MIVHGRHWPKQEQKRELYNARSNCKQGKMNIRSGRKTRTVHILKRDHTSKDMKKAMLVGLPHKVVRPGVVVRFIMQPI